ncbi:MAG: 3-dehydroquinate synthase [Gemmatimonadales bacterium]|nr:3-dehydroquinate synthase [Gemmatimonadales bacterium]
MVAGPRILVRHGLGEYPVIIRPGLLDDLDSLAEEVLPGRRLVAITDRNVARAVPPTLKCPFLVVPPGESSKTRRRWADLTDQLLELGLTRQGALVAVGGGVVGDLTGFVAATYLRGIPFLQVPTSLLAMVDASVGGKTGLNTKHGKNLVGAFHPPAAVAVDPLAIRSLRSAHVRGGLMEAIKHGVIADAAYYDWIADSTRTLLARDPVAVTRLVTTSVTIKSEVVGADEKEEGRRAILNAGHTVGHALERWSGYRIPHGDAVGIGLHVETVLAEDLGLAPPGTADLLRSRLTALGLPLTLPPASDDDALLEAMHHDKKVRDHALRFALPRAPGLLASLSGAWTTAVSDDSVRQSLGRARTLYQA